MYKKVYILLIVIIVLFISVYICIDMNNRAKKEIVEQNIEVFDPIEIPQLDFSQGVEKILKKDTTIYSVFVAYPDENKKPYVYNSESMRSASMIKVFILAAAMENVHNGRVDLNDTIVLTPANKVGGAGVISEYEAGTVFSLDKLMQLMITESDNTATNMLIDYLGMDMINNYIQRNGYSDTVLQRKMMDSKAIQEGRENYTSVTDLGNFFIKLYKHELIGYEQDEKMIEYLKGQTDTECFPSTLPNSIIAHKTGELVGMYNDGGIIYNRKKNIVLVIMAENYSSRDKAVSNMKKMTEFVAGQNQ